MKKFIGILLAVLMICTMIVPVAAVKDPDRPEWIFHQYTSDEVQLYWCNDFDAEIEIPAEYNGLSVAEIGAEAFMDCSGLVSVKIPESVKRIGERAFANCPSLTSVSVPDSVEEIEEHAFGYIVNDTEVLKVPGFEISGSAGSAAEQYAKDNGFPFNGQPTCTHDELVCVNCGASLTKAELLEAWGSGDDQAATASLFSEGSATYIAVMAALVVGLVGGLLIGRRKRKTA